MRLSRLVSRVRRVRAAGVYVVPSSHGIELFCAQATRCLLRKNVPKRVCGLVAREKFSDEGQFYVYVHLGALVTLSKAGGATESLRSG